MFHIEFNIEDEHLGEVFKFFSTKINVFNLEHHFIPNVDLMNDTIGFAYKNGNE